MKTASAPVPDPLLGSGASPPFRKHRSRAAVDSLPAGGTPGLDPTANTAAAIDRVVYANIYEGLVKVDSQGGFLPGLANGWHVSERRPGLHLQPEKGVVFTTGKGLRCLGGQMESASGPPGRKTATPTPSISAASKPLKRRTATPW
jgi:ABC-type transport system substrate-binding protein